MLEDVVGRVYGPVHVSISAAKVAEYVAATSDDPARWVDHAPPAYAGAILFAIAPDFLSDPDVAPNAAMVIHGQQTFAWHDALAVGTTAALTGRLDRVRDRGGVGFANFSLTLEADSGVILRADSTFLMSGDVPPGGGTDEIAEPAPDERGSSEVPATIECEDGPLPAIDKSASRADVVRYAAASGDFNPIHWDHGLAVSAGLGGVVAHGLLVSAWASQCGARLVDSPRPLVSAKVRFRSPYYPASQAAVSGVRDGTRVVATVGTGDVEHVSAQLELAAVG